MNEPNDLLRNENVIIGAFASIISFNVFKAEISESLGWVLKYTQSFLLVKNEIWLLILILFVILIMMRLGKVMVSEVWITLGKIIMLPVGIAFLMIGLIFFIDVYLLGNFMGNPTLSGLLGVIMVPLYIPVGISLSLQLFLRRKTKKGK